MPDCQSPARSGRLSRPGDGVEAPAPWGVGCPHRRQPAAKNEAMLRSSTHPSDSGWWRARLRDPAFWVLLAATLFVARVAEYFARAYFFNVIDDAYISFNYAKNWSLGHGLVFNPGQRVEGYTNFLWIVTLTPLVGVTRLLGMDFTRAAIVLNAIIALYDLALLYAIGRIFLRRDWTAISIAILLCSLDGSYLGYAISGLENHLFIFLALAAIIIWLKQPRRTWLWMGLSLTLVNMTRPDGILFVGTFVVAIGSGLLWRSKQSQAPPRAVVLRQLVKVCACYLLCYGAYFIWRYCYYDALLPNTFYLKVGDSWTAAKRGWDYTVIFLADRYYLPLFALLAVRWVRQPVVRWLLLYVVVHVVYVIYVGGDFYSGHRFYVVILPILYLLIAFVAGRIRNWLASTQTWQQFRREAWMAAVVVGLLAALGSNGAHLFVKRGFDRGPYTHEIVRWRNTVNGTIQFNKWMKIFATPGSQFVVGDIGSAGFFTDLEIIDVYGVIDPVIARKKVENFGRGKAGHEKRGSVDYLLRSGPKYVKWGYTPGDHRRRGYYIFTDFPKHLHVEGLWIKEDLGPGHFIKELDIHFSRQDLARWRAKGSAFKSYPSYRASGGQRTVFGQEGSFINTFAPGTGDIATGRLTSPPIELKGDLMVLSIGGGRDPEQLRVSLLIDGKRVFSATGHDHETLGRRVWDISPYKGRAGQIEIVDNSTAGWGHILVDEVRQFVRTGS